MKCAVIDIGSNSMRLTAYDAQRTSFRVLFKEKRMAGLASYVEDGRLTEEGILCACDGLKQFAETLKVLEMNRVSVFATASLRNVENTQAAVADIRAATGFQVEVVSGQEEAQLGFLGAMTDLKLSQGIFVDIGGASTELVVFSHRAPRVEVSFPIGSLKLYRDCVKNILPGAGSQARMQKRIAADLRLDTLTAPACGPMACVGGTARAALKLCRRLFSLPEEERAFTAEQLDALCARVLRADRAAADLILKTEPERIHTLVPGLMILRDVVHRFDIREIWVSQYGVREGYLCQRIQSAL